MTNKVGNHVNVNVDFAHKIYLSLATANGKDVKVVAFTKLKGVTCGNRQAWFN